jgi:MoaA/NifB/PqqE/SkfB family radical SAM enzyme
VVNINKRINFLRGLLSGDTARTGPVHAVIDPTYRCNFQCVGCQYHSPFKKPENHEIKGFPPDLFKKVCREFRTMGTQKLFLCGSGEPFLHPELPEMVSFAKAEGFEVMVFTNGSLLDHDKVQTLIDAKLDTLRVSLWASSEEQFQQNNPDSEPGMFSRITEGLELLSRLKAERKSRYPILCLSIIINRSNLKAINSMVDLAVRTGCEELFFSIPWDSPEVSSSLALSEEEGAFTQSSLLRTKKRLNKLSMKHNINDVILHFEMGTRAWEKIPCYVAWYNIIVRCDGTVIPCCRCHHIKLGHVSENTLQEIWNGPAIRAFRKQTLVHEEPFQINKQGHCDNCGYLSHNLLVHKYFKWFLPFIRNRIKHE